MTWECGRTGMYEILPARHGYKWNEEELKQLRARYKKGWSIEYLAEKHQRTQNAIKFMLNSNESELIINGTNYARLFFCVKELIRLKIELNSKLPYG